MDERVFAGGGGPHPELPGVRDGNRRSGGHKFKKEVASRREKGREAPVKSAGSRNRNCGRTPREARESLQCQKYADTQAKSRGRNTGAGSPKSPFVIARFLDGVT